MNNFALKLGLPALANETFIELNAFVKTITDDNLFFFHDGFYAYTQLYLFEPHLAKNIIDMFKYDFSIEDVRMHKLLPNINIQPHIDNKKSGRSAAINFIINESDTTTNFLNNDTDELLYSINYEKEMVLLNVLQKHSVTNRNTLNDRWTITMKIADCSFADIVQLHKQGKLLK